VETPKVTKRKIEEVAEDQQIVVTPKVEVGTSLLDSVSAKKKLLKN
jgi:hypothetical protein